MIMFLLFFTILTIDLSKIAMHLLLQSWPSHIIDPDAMSLNVWDCCDFVEILGLIVVVLIFRRYSVFIGYLCG